MTIKRTFVASLFAAASLLAAPLSWADLSSYSQDFEGLDQASPTALGDDGWLVFANVFDGTSGNFLYGYGPFAAPNGGPAFSGIDLGQGGPDQGAQQLVVYSDYNNGDHGNGNLIEANVFQEQIVGAADVGETYTFRFDAKRGNIGGATTALAFIKTLDPNAGFALTNFLTVDTTSLPDTWDTFEIPIVIDASLDGQIFQIGFASTATNFEESGVFYDNVSLAAGVDDTDEDGVADDVDNCTDDANPQQIDSNGDGFGNVCDADLNNDCLINFLDLGQMKSVFFSNDADADLVGPGNSDPDGLVNFFDLGRMKATFFGAPGPSMSECVPIPQ